jgi:CP family cyanate transporter-like MFS transporter
LAIVAVAVNLRCGVTSLGAVLGQLTRAWGLSGTESGLLTALPVCTFALVGALAPVLARRYGPERLVAAAMGLAAAGLGARAVATSVLMFATSSVLALSGAAIGNVLLPPLVKRYFPHRTGAVTALYSTALALGLTGGAALTVPAEHAFDGDWRIGLAIWMIPALLAVPPWLALAAVHGPPAAEPPASGPSRRELPVRRAVTARWLAVFFGCQSLNAYVVLGWLPSILSGAGLDARAASLPLAVAGAMSVPVSLVVPTLAARHCSQYGMVVATTAAYAGGYLGLLCAPAALPWLWAALLGAGNGALPLAVTMIGLRSRRPEITTALSALSQSAGYLLAAVGPILFGVLHESFGGWRVPLLAVLTTLLAQLFSGMRAARPTVVEIELSEIYRPRHAR